MKLYEIATNVEVTDGDRKYFYWVPLAKPERAIRAALKKHRTVMGLGMTVKGQTIADAPLTARIIPHKGLDPALTMSSS